MPEVTYFPMLYVSTCMMMGHRPCYVYGYRASGPYDINIVWSQWANMIMSM